MTGNGWSEWQNHILAELRRLSAGVQHIADSNEDDHKEIRSDIAKTNTEVAMLKVKASLWGAIAGAIPTGLAILWYILSKG